MSYRVISIRSLKFIEQREAEDKLRKELSGIASHTHATTATDNTNVNNDNKQTRKSIRPKSSLGTSQTTMHEPSVIGEHKEGGNDERNSNNNSADSNAATSTSHTKSVISIVYHEKTAANASESNTNTNNKTRVANDGNTDNTGKDNNNNSNINNNQNTSSKDNNNQRSNTANNNMHVSLAAQSHLSKLSTPIIVDQSINNRRTALNQAQVGVWSGLGHVYCPRGDIKPAAVTHNEYLREYAHSHEHKEHDSHHQHRSQLASRNNHHLITHNANNNTATISSPRDQRTKMLVMSTKASPTDALVMSNTDDSALAVGDADSTIDRVLRWRHLFDSAKQKMDRALIKRLVSRAESRAMVYSSPKLMDDAVNMLINKHTRTDKRPIS